MAKKYQSELLGVLHQDALADYQLGIISDKEMREYDEDCLVPEPKKDQRGARKTPTSAYSSPQRA